MQHAQQQVLDRYLWEFMEKGAAVRGFATCDQAIGVFVNEFVPASEKEGIALVGLRSVCGRPGVAFEDHGQEDDSAGPHVQGAGVVGAWKREVSAVC